MCRGARTISSAFRSTAAPAAIWRALERGSRGAVADRMRFGRRLSTSTPPQHRVGSTTARDSLRSAADDPLPLDALVAATDLGAALTAGRRRSAIFRHACHRRRPARPARPRISTASAGCTFPRTTARSTASRTSRIIRRTTCPTSRAHWSLMAEVSESSAKPVDARRRGGATRSTAWSTPG